MDEIRAGDAVAALVEAAVGVSRMLIAALFLIVVAILVGLLADSFFDGRLPMLLSAWRGAGDRRWNGWKRLAG